MMAANLSRPTFHFTATSGWINDPHGITYRDGGYDAFYQYVPHSPVWQPNCHWGHARGDDLLSLRELPVAIAPGEGDDGIWTGALVTDDQGDAHVLYTSTSIPDFGIGRIRTAAPLDADWIQWRKGAVVATAPDGLDLIAYRDPFIRREGDLWRMFVGAGSRDGTAMALTYISEEPSGQWRYDGVTLARSTHETDPVWTGALWECPQFFAVEDRQAMVSSVWDADQLHYTAYALGSYTNGKFQADTWGRLTYGPSYYAPSLFFDSKQRPCLTFWMRGIADPDARWVGAHSLPHLLKIEGNRLVAVPHPDIERYHARLDLTTPATNAQAVDITWNPAAGDNVRIARGSKDCLSLHQTRTDLRIHVDETDWTVPSTGHLRIIIDGPVLEIAGRGVNFGAAVPPPGEELVIITTRGRAPEVRTLARPTGSGQPAHSGPSLLTER